MLLLGVVALAGNTASYASPDAGASNIMAPCVKLAAQSPYYPSATHTALRHTIGTLFANLATTCLEFILSGMTVCAAT